MVLVMVLWLLPIRPARSVATCERLPTTSSSSEFFDASAEDTVCRFVTRLSMSPERDANAVSTWSRLPMMEPTWVSSACTVVETAAPLLMSWLICAVSPSSAPGHVLDEGVGLGRVDRREHRAERVQERVDAGVGHVVAHRDGGAVGEDRPRFARVELDLLLPDHVVPAHPDVGRAAAASPCC